MVLSWLTTLLLLFLELVLARQGTSSSSKAEPPGLLLLRLELRRPAETEREEASSRLPKPAAESLWCALLTGGAEELSG